MKSNKELLNNILNNSIEGIILIKDGFITDINQSLVEILKYESKNELIGNLVTGVLIPNINTKYIKYESKTYQELNIITKNGETIPVLIKIIDLDKRNKVAYILNLSELKEKEKLLITKSKHSAMGEMISMIAHQWRQPLTAISATINNLSLQIILGKELNKNELEKELSLINDYAQYLSGTIDDFRNFYKKDKVKRLVTIESIVEQAINIIKPSLSSNLINLDINFESHEKIKTYATEINHVVLNILKNAEDVLIENKIINPKITIRTFKNEKNVFLEIENNGNKIKEENINKIFEPYFSTRLSKDGTGLGLYMSKVIIEEHCNGLLSVKNSKNGVIFKISIPKE